MSGSVTGPSPRPSTVDPATTTPGTTAPSSPAATPSSPAPSTPMSTGGPRTAAPLDPAATRLLEQLNRARGSGPGWLSFLDAASSTRALAEKVVRDGKVTGQEVLDLVKDAKDYGKITRDEKKVLEKLVNERASAFEPHALSALKEFLGLGGAGPTAPTTPATGPVMRVVEGTSAYKLDDDTLYMTREGKFSSSIGRDIYTAGYLPRTDGPLNGPLGTRSTDSAVLPDADDRVNKEKSPVERFDEVMKRATGRAGGLAAKYAVDGKQPEAESWWGYCDRWAYAALDPEIATRVNKPIYMNGVYFSTAELRGLASYLGRSDEDFAKGLFDKSVTPLDLQKATTMFLDLNGPGFISDVWLDSAHPGNAQVWNQPFDAVDQNVRELKGDELARVLKDQFKLTGSAAVGKRIHHVETTGHYGVEAGEEHEGAATHAKKNWKSYILTDMDGKALDGKWAPGSDEAPEWIWRPHRTGEFSAEGRFFRDLISKGVPAEKVKGFESALGGLPRGALSDAQKADLRSRFGGVAAAYPREAFAATLAPYGLRPEDFQ